MYVEMAATLARSFRRTNPGPGTTFVLAVEHPDRVPRDVRKFVEVLPVNTDDYGTGFEIKLALDRLSKAGRTLFIDADCLVVRNLDNAFAAFAGRSVSAVGEAVSHGEWFGDIASRCRHAGVPAVPRFVGSVYYFDDSPIAESVFATARRLSEQYDELGIARLRGRKNEEPLLSLAMAMHNQTPIPDDGTIKADAMHFPDRIHVRVQNQVALFERLSEGRMRTNPSIAEARPAIAHFNDEYARHPVYLREAAVLRWGREKWLPSWLAVFLATLLVDWPRRGRDDLKNLLRPFYHRLFGVRKVKANSRL